MTQPKKRRTQREMFEAWWSRKYENPPWQIPPYLPVDNAWVAWQAAVRANRRKRT